MNRDKSSFLQSKKLSPADKLREQLTELERIVSLPKDKLGIQARSFLSLVDDVHAELLRLTADGAELSAEQGRFDDVVARMSQRAETFLSAIGETQLFATRPPHATRDSHPWFFLDEIARDNKARRLKPYFRILGIAVGIVGIVWLAFNTFLKPDPATVEKTSRFETAMELATAQDYPAAINEIDRVLEILPDDVDARVFKAVLLQKTGDAAGAKILLDEANSLAETDIAVPLAAARLWQQLGENRTAITLAEGVLEQYPDSAEAWFIAGQSHAALGETDAAREALSKAAELALAQGNDSLYVIAKTNLTYLSPMGGNGNGQ